MNKIKIEKRHKEVIGISLMVIGLFILINLIIDNATKVPEGGVVSPFGNLGFHISNLLVTPFGKIGSYSIPLLIIVCGWMFFAKKSFDEYRKIFYYIVFYGLLFSMMFGLLNYNNEEDTYGLLAGEWGVVSARLVANLIGKSFSFVFVGVLFSSSIINIFNFSVYDFFISLMQKIKSIEFRREKKPLTDESPIIKSNEPIDISITNNEEAEDQSTDTSITSNEEAEDLSSSDIATDNFIDDLDYNKDGTIPDKMAHDSITIDDEVTIDEAEREKINSRYNEYKIPSVNLLSEPVEISGSLSDDELRNKGEQLIHSLNTFGVDGKLVRISPGPIITLYEVEPAEGVKVSKFTNLSDDLARVMQAKSIRIIAPIPGTRSVGIELPNNEPATVYFKSIVNSSKFADSESKLTIALGKDTIGDAFVFDLSDMPHLLVAGATGSGKSVGINTIISSILFKAKPDEVKFILIDPKKLELATYKSLVGYHLITAPNLDEYVMTTPDNALGILDSAITEMERRFQVFADATVRHIKEYHEKCKSDKELENIPYIVVIIDELADIMMTSSKAIEEPITRLAQKARAVGIHLVVATQRPSVDVITGLIKSNFPARISYHVSTRDNSKIIIDQIGAEKLLGRGDLLFLMPGAHSPIRIHNAFLTLPEIENIMEDISSQPKPNEVLLPQSKERKISSEFDISGDQDELLKDAATLVVSQQMASVSMLQRRFRIGYSRAGRIIDELEALGIISGHSGSKAREVLVDEAYISNIFNSE